MNDQFLRIFRKKILRKKNKYNVTDKYYFYNISQLLLFQEYNSLSNIIIIFKIQKRIVKFCKKIFTKIFVRIN